MKKFNGFESTLIIEALTSHIEALEKQVSEETQKNRGRNLIFAEGYFNMVGKELIEKVKTMTRKADL